MMEGARGGRSRHFLNCSGGRVAAGVWDRRLTVAQHVLAALACAIAVISMLGWALGKLVLASVSSSYVPMPPVNGILSLALCGVMIGTLHAPVRSARARGLALGVAATGGLVCVLSLTDFFLGLHVSLDRVFVPRDVTLNGAQIGRISPVSAIAFAVLFAAVALLQYPSLWPQRAGVGLALLVTAVAFVLLIGYLYNAPLLYGAGLIPVSLPTATSLILVGLAVAALGGTCRWPFSLFMDDSVQSQIMRGVMPVVMIATLAVAGLDEVSRTFNRADDPLAMSGIFLVTFLAIVATVVRSTDLIGRRLARAETRRMRAEEERDAHQQHLESLVQERTADLVAANVELRDATATKSQFLANMSHELRTPLNSIIGFSGILTQGLTGPLEKEQLTQIQMINRSGKHLLMLVDDILDLAKIEAGKAELNIEKVDLAAIIREVGALVRPLAESKGIGIRVDMCTGKVSLSTDGGKVQQILFNLVGNAVKFTHQGGVVIAARHTSDHGVSIAVTDTGPGISCDDLPRVFEDFTQIATPGGAKPPGTGLGLRISREFAHMLGGQVTAESTLGVGSTFTFTLPAEPPAAEAAIASDGS
jgi:signal transduction histidine kinase